MIKTNEHNVSFNDLTVDTAGLQALTHSGEMFAEQIITVIGGIIEKELDAREKAQQKRIKKYTDKYAKKEVAEA